MNRLSALSTICIALAGCEQANNITVNNPEKAVVNQEAAFEPLNTIEPAELKIGPVRAPRCAKPVKVLIPELACRQHDCNTKAFFKEPLPVLENQRAIHVFDCNNATARGQLLTDREPRFNSTAILVLQDIRHGDMLWEQRKSNGHYRIEFGTEASEGLLSLSTQGKYSWTESLP
jgi:hypothetical protein